MATTLRALDVDLITRGHLEKGLARLRDEFAGTFSAETVERFMAESLEALGGARLKNYVPLLVHRFARERLRALGQEAERRRASLAAARDGAPREAPRRQRLI